MQDLAVKVQFVHAKGERSVVGILVVATSRHSSKLLLRSWSFTDLERALVRLQWHVCLALAVINMESVAVRSSKDGPKTGTVR